MKFQKKNNFFTKKNCFLKDKKISLKKIKKIDYLEKKK